MLLDKKDIEGGNKLSEEQVIKNIILSFKEAEDDFKDLENTENIFHQPESIEYIRKILDYITNKDSKKIDFLDQDVGNGLLEIRNIQHLLIGLLNVVRKNHNNLKNNDLNETNSKNNKEKTEDKSKSNDINNKESSNNKNKSENNKEKFKIREKGEVITDDDKKNSKFGLEFLIFELNKSLGGKEIEYNKETKEKIKEFIVNHYEAFLNINFLIICQDEKLKKDKDLVQIIGNTKLLQFILLCLIEDFNYNPYLEEVADNPLFTTLIDNFKDSINSLVKNGLGNEVLNIIESNNIEEIKKNKILELVNNFIENYVKVNDIENLQYNLEDVKEIVLLLKKIAEESGLKLEYHISEQELIKTISNYIKELTEYKKINHKQKLLDNFGLNKEQFENSENSYEEIINYISKLFIGIDEKNKELTEKIEVLNSEIKVITEVSEDSITEIRKLEEEINKYKSDLKYFEDKLPQIRRILGINDENISTAETFKKILIKVRSIILKNSNLLKSEKEYINKMAEKNNEINKLENIIINLKSYSIITSKEKTKFENYYNNLNDKYSKLQNKFKNLAKENINQDDKDEIKKLKQENSALNFKNNGLVQQINNTNKDLKSKEEKIIEKEEKNKKLTNTIGEQTQTINDLNIEKDEMQKTMDEQAEYIKKLESLNNMTVKIIPSSVLNEFEKNA